MSHRERDTEIPLSAAESPQTSGWVSEAETDSSDSEESGPEHIYPWLLHPWEYTSMADLLQKQSKQ